MNQKTVLDYFPTPPWATRALCEENIRNGIEPACGEGHMVRPLTEYFNRVIFEWNGEVMDYLKTMSSDWVITNPPFNLASDFIHNARNLQLVLLFFLRSAFIESVRSIQYFI